MIRFIGAKRALRMTIVVMSLLAAGCGLNTSSTQQAGGAGNVVSITPALLLASITSAIQQPVARALGGWDWTSFFNSFGNLLSSINFNNTLEMQKISYVSTGADGLPHTMSGLLILPKSIFGSKPSVPILMYQHASEPFRPYSPSQFLSHLNRPADYPEVMVAAAIASTGYAVAMADYEGLGDSTGTQPYVHGTSLALQVVGMLRASRDKIALSSSPCTWNSQHQLFLMGYSQGGYATMAATRELLLPKYAGEFTVTASAPLSGPHDLSGVMRGVILSTSTSKAPYFLPFLLTGYSYVYGQTSIFNPLSAMVSPYNTTVPPRFDGTSPSDVISEVMGMRFSPLNLIVPRSVLTTTFSNLLATDTLPGSAFDFFRRNDSYRVSETDISTWVPTVPMRMYHHRLDELVPYANSQVAFDAFSTAGAKSHPQRPGVELVEEPVFLNIAATDPVKTVHFGAAFPELSDGWNWLNSFKN